MAKKKEEITSGLKSIVQKRGDLFLNLDLLLVLDLLMNGGEGTSD